MAQFFVSASDPSALSRLTRRHGDVSLDVVDDGGQSAIRLVLPGDTGAFYPHVFSFDDAGQFADGEIVVRYRQSDAQAGTYWNHGNGVACRAQTADLTMYNGGAARIALLRMDRANAGAFANLTNLNTGHFPEGYAWYRMRVSGSTLRIRQWTGAAGDDPGTWASTITNTAITAAGYWGLFCSARSLGYPVDHLWTDIGIGTGDDPAPTEPVGPPPALNSPFASGITATSVVPNVSVTF